MIEIKSYIPVLSFPNNVVVVASPTGRAPPEEPGEWRVNSLSRALRMPRNIQKMFDDFGDGIAPYLLEWGSTSTSTMTECSILVHEGTYFLNSDFLEDIDGKFGKLNVEVVGVQNRRRSIVRVNDCVFHRSVAKAFATALNCKLTVTNCNIQTQWLMELRTNKDGEIKFNRNKVIRMPLILKDEMSKLPIHDFSRVEINVANLKSKSNFTTCASASASHKKLVAKYMQGGISYAPKDIHKVCFYCHLNQVTKDFLWCSKCKSTCYCSKDCQAKDWPDHKLNCKPFINRS